MLRVPPLTPPETISHRAAARRHPTSRNFGEIMKRLVLFFVVLAGAVYASATSVNYQFSYAVGNGNVSGVLNTVDEGNGTYFVTNATGSYPGLPSVDIGGIVFELNGNTNIASGINLYWDGVGYRSIDGGNNGPYVQLSLTPLDPAAPTPEPGTLAMVCTGVVGAAGILRRRLGLPLNTK